MYKDELRRDFLQKEDESEVLAGYSDLRCGNIDAKLTGAREWRERQRPEPFFVRVQRRVMLF